MPTPYPIFQKWSAGKTTINVFLKIPNAWTAEMISYLDFDAITIDLQHGPLDFPEMVTMLQAMNKEKYPMVRLAWNDPAEAMHCLDAGVKGVICPMINNRAEAEAFVSACYYPPVGTRSYGPWRANESITMESLKSKTMSRLKEDGLVDDARGKSSRASYVWKIAASVALLAVGYWMGSRELFVTMPSSSMNKYALFLYENSEFTVPEGSNLVADYSAWAGNLATQNRLIGAEKLNDQELFWLGKPTVQNSASKLTGYFIFYAADYTEAKRIAETHPHTHYGGGIELRPIDVIR